jgi:hypothetical protein
MKNSDLNDFLIRLKRNISHYKKHGEFGLIAEEFPATDSSNQNSIHDIQNTVARMRSNLSITESRNASFFFDFGDLT